MDGILNNFVDPYNLLELADDAASAASDIESLKNKILALLDYYDRNFLRLNI